MILSRLLIPATLLVSIPLVGSLPSLSQIASPANAGGNSGNSTSGSSATPIGTADFTPAVAPVSTSPSVTVTSTGTVTAPPTVITAVNQAVNQAVNAAVNIETFSPGATPASSTLSVVVKANPAAVPVGAQALQKDIVVGIVDSPTKQEVSFGELPTVAEGVVQIGREISVTKISTSRSGVFTVNDDGTISVTTLDSTTKISSSPDTQAALVDLVSISIVSGLTPVSIELGARLVRAGVSPSDSAQLMSALQGLANPNQSDLTSLSNGIDTFNSIVRSANESTLTALAGDPVFAEAGLTLSAARSALK